MKKLYMYFSVVISAMVVVVVVGCELHKHSAKKRPNTQVYKPDPQGTSTEPQVSISREIKTLLSIYDKNTLLLFATRNNKSHSFIVELLKMGADVNARTEYGRTPLHSAVFHENIKVVELLIAAGANVNARDNDGWTPLFVTAQNNNLEAINVLVEAGANVNAQNKHNKTPLHYAVKHTDPQFVITLLNAGANVNVKDKDRKTPLHLAVERNKLSIVALLILSGADINAQDKDGKKANDYLNQ